MSGGTKAAIVSVIGVTVLANVILFWGKFKKAISDLKDSVHKTSQSQVCKNEEKSEPKK